MSSNVTPFPQAQPRPPAAASISALLEAPLHAYRLTVERDPSRLHRLILAIIAVVVAALALLAAWHDTASRSAGSLVPIGLGRLASLAADAGWSLAWVMSALELAYYALICLVFAGTVWFGATSRPIPLPNEMLIFHRRQSRWVAGTPVLLSLLGFAAAWLLVSEGFPLLAVPVEVVCISVLCTAIWQVLVPEARVSLSVILDGKAGWGNRLILSGGMFRYVSRCTITKDCLKRAEARDVGGLEFLVNARTLNLCLLENTSNKSVLRIRGIAPDPEIGVLANILSTRFMLGVTRETLNRAQAVGRWPVELSDTLNGQM